VLEKIPWSSGRGGAFFLTSLFIELIGSRSKREIALLASVDINLRFARNSG